MFVMIPEIGSLQISYMKCFRISEFYNFTIFQLIGDFHWVTSLVPQQMHVFAEEEPMRQKDF